MSMTVREGIVRHYSYFHSWTDGGATDKRRSDAGVSEVELDCEFALPPENAVPDRKSLIGSVLEALHDSRGRQASRAIHQYRHLIAAPRSVKTNVSQRATNIFEQPKGRIKMTTSDDANGRHNAPSTSVMTSKNLTWVLIAACVIGFAILHIAGGAMIDGAVKPSTEMPPVQLTGD